MNFGVIFSKTKTYWPKSGLIYSYLYYKCDYVSMRSLNANNRLTLAAIAVAIDLSDNACFCGGLVAAMEMPLPSAEID
jgi:hypothetical protein